jgi:hypothetical protein
MEVEEKNMLIVRQSEIKSYDGLAKKITELLKKEKCANTAIKESCSSSACNLILYFNKKFTDNRGGSINDISGFLTVNVKGGHGEFFNLCSSSSSVTESLLNFAIYELKLKSYWIGLPMKSPNFGENVKIFAKIGFGNPVIVKTSPSGIILDYEFIALVGPYEQSSPGETFSKAVFLKKTSSVGAKKIVSGSSSAGKIKTSKKENTPPERKARPYPSVEKTKTPIKDVKSPIRRTPKIIEKVTRVDRDPIKKVPINTNYKKVPRSFMRADKTSVYLQNECLNDYLVGGRLVDGHELDGLELKEVKDKLREGGYISEGTYGVVYKACIDTDCNYIIKIQNLGTFARDPKGNIEATPEVAQALADWKKEVDLTITFNKYGIGSKITDAWLCANETMVGSNVKKELFGIFAAEKWDGDLRDDECPSREIIEKLENQVKNIHGMGLVHGDIFPKNVLVKRNWFGTVTDATLSDFGTVDTKENWMSNYEWMMTFYEYHTVSYKRITSDYYQEGKNGRKIFKQDFLNDPSLMDYDMIYYYKKKCGYM